MDPAAQERLTALFHEHSRRVLAYLLHRGAGDEAADLLSETFAVAWRRLDAVPDDPLPWLLVVARNVLAHHHRSHRRSRALVETWALEQRRPDVVTDVAEDVADRNHVRSAVSSLSAEDREVLMLVGWDGLTATEAAVVLGCAPGAFSVRLHRARRRLQRALDTPPQGSPGTPPVGAAATSRAPAHARPARACRPRATAPSTPVEL